MQHLKQQLDVEWQAVKNFENATNRANFNHWMRYGRYENDTKQKFEFIEFFKFQLFLKYNPSQARVPAGQTGGGQWMNGSGASFTPVSEKLQKPVSLLAEEAKGGHTLARHVGKSDAYLTDRVKNDKVKIGMFEYQGAAKSTYPDQATAEKYVNRVLDDPYNAKRIADVARGKNKFDALENMFENFTGRQAYRNNADGFINFHNVKGALVAIVHDKNSERGYRILTSYPIDNYSSPKF